MMAREAMNRLRREGWAEHAGKGSHSVFTKSEHNAVPVPYHGGDMLNGAHLSVARAVGWERPSGDTGRGGESGWRSEHYYAIAERGNGQVWWISFPGRDGIISAADDAGQIVAQAQDALASAAMYGDCLPPAIEDGTMPPADLSDFEQPVMVIVIPFPAPQAAA